MPPTRLYSLAHLSDLHISFDEPHPYDALLAADPSLLSLAKGGGFRSVEEMVKALEFCSLGSVAALESAATTVETELLEAAAAGRRFDCLVTGDICTWPYDGNRVQRVYGYFSGGFDYDGVGGIGFRDGLTDYFMFALGNHDTHAYWKDDHYRGSAFHAIHHIAEHRRVYALRLPRPGKPRWIVFFVCRTDYFNPRGWLGRRDEWTGEPSHLKYFRDLAGETRAGRGLLAGKGCAAADYDEAVKILVLHHSPLARARYRRVSLFDYLTTGLNSRSAVKPFADDLGIHLILFGHTHERLEYLEDGRLYLDVGTTSASTLTDIEAERAAQQAVKPYTFNVYDFNDDDSLDVRPFTMTVDVNEFLPGATKTYLLERDHVVEGA